MSEPPQIEAVAVLVEQCNRQRGDAADGAAAIAAAVAAADVDAVFAFVLAVPVLHQVAAVFKVGVPVLGSRHGRTIEPVTQGPCFRLFFVRMCLVTEDEMWRGVNHPAQRRGSISPGELGLVERSLDTLHLFDVQVHGKALIFGAQHPVVENPLPPVGKPQHNARCEELQAFVRLSQFIAQPHETDQMCLERSRHAQRTRIAVS